MRTLSKSRLLAFKQCPKRLWLEVYRRDLSTTAIGASAGFAAGQAVGEVARKIYDPDDAGTLVGEGGCNFDEIGNLVEPNERPATDGRAGLPSHGWRGATRNTRQSREVPIVRIKRPRFGNSLRRSGYNASTIAFRFASYSSWVIRPLSFSSLI